MPTYIITDPSGATYRVQAPDGATEQEAIAYTQRNANSSAPKESTPLTQFADGAQAFTTGALSALTLGGIDHLVAAADALTHKDPGDFSTRYERARKAFRAPLRDNPWAGTAGEIVGGVATGLGAAAALPKIVPALSRVGPLIQTMLTGGVEGGIYGGLTSAPERRGEGALIGGVLGGGGAGLGQGAVRGLSGAWHYLKSGLFPDAPAVRRLRSALAETGMDPDYISQRLQQGDTEFLADLDPELQGLLLESVHHGGASAKHALERITARTANQGRRLMRWADENISGMRRDDVLTDLQARQDGVTQLYQGAYENIPVTAQLSDILKRPGSASRLPAVVDALDNASLSPDSPIRPEDLTAARTFIARLTPSAKAETSVLVGLDGRPLTPDPATEGTINTRILHVLSQTLRDRAHALTSPEAGVRRSNTHAKLLGDLQHALDTYLKEVSPAFATAQAAQLPVKRMRDAFRLGQDIFRAKGTVDDIQRELHTLSGGRAQLAADIKPYFNAGVRDALYATTTRGKDADNLMQQFATTDRRKRIGLAVDDPHARDAFMRTYQKEQRMFALDKHTRNVKPESVSAKFNQMDEEIRFATTRVGLAGGPWARMHLGRVLARKARKSREHAMWNEIADVLTQPHVSIPDIAPHTPVTLPPGAVGLPISASLMGED